MNIRILIGKSLMKTGDLIEKSRWLLKKILVFGLGFCVGLAICAISDIQWSHEKQKVETFIHHMITSTINQTEFFKEHSTEEGRKNLQKYADEFSSVYKIYVFDHTFGAYESEVIFDNGKNFYVDISVYKDDIVLMVFKPGEWPRYTIPNVKE